MWDLVKHGEHCIFYLQHILSFVSCKRLNVSIYGDLSTRMY